MAQTPTDAPAGTTPTSAAARLFDIRLLIGGLFVIYGVMLTIAGFAASAAQKAKAAGININLWMGLAMLALGLFFLLWWRTRPLQHPAATTPADGDPPAG